jgi:hypothetical protein
MKSYTWRYRDAQGKSKQITSRNLQEVRTKRDEIRDSLNKGAYVDPRRADVTLREYAERWLTNRKPLVEHATVGLLPALPGQRHPPCAGGLG